MSAQRLNRILVVDDDPVIAKSFDRVLSGQGYAVVTACDGEEALRKIAAEDYDAVFTDIKMPGIDGIEVAKQIRSQRPWMPVVIVSGYATAENEARAKAAGVCAVLHKPLTPQMIEQSARDALRGPAPGTPAAALEMPAAAPVPMAAATDEAPAAANFGPGTQAIAAPLLTLTHPPLGPFTRLVALVPVPLRHFAKWLVARPTTQFTRWGRDITLFFAAPFLGLAYIVLLPFVGLGAFVWVGYKAVFDHHAKTASVPGEMK